MFIRSQDKRKLKDCDEFSIVSSPNQAAILGVKGELPSSNVVPIMLGSYESETRAIEVVNEIQKQIVTGYSTDEIVGRIRTISQIVFEMPEK